MDTDMKKLVGVAIAIFVVLIAVALVYIGKAEVKEIACEIEEDSSSTALSYQNGVCYNSTGDDVTSNVEALGAIDNIAIGLTILISLIALVVLVKVFGPILKSVSGFGGGGGKY